MTPGLLAIVLKGQRMHLLFYFSQHTGHFHVACSRFSTVLPVQCDRCWDGGWVRVFLVGEARGWVASREGS